jgi:uncharacterized NAD(P)/FAD-binding protein YdhS
MMRAHPHRISVIGGGAAGAAVVAELLVHGNPRVQVTWFAGHGARGRGVAYGTRRQEHILNVRAANMGLLDDDTGQFIRFLSERGWTDVPTAFVPRSLFGDYVAATLTRLMTDAHERPLVDVRDVEAMALTPRDDGGFVVTDGKGQQTQADDVVLAIGALPSMPLPQVDESALRGGRYFTDPWSLQPEEFTPDRVLVIGSRLTAVDTILTAAQAWPHAQLFALSRHGCLPGAHTPQPLAPYEQQHAVTEDLLAAKDVRCWLRIVREVVREENLDWRTLIDGVRPDTNALWQSLDATQRGRFVRHVRWLWDAARHRMPPQTADTIDGLRQSGRLEILTGRVQRIQGERPIVTYRQRRDGEIKQQAFDLVIQSTGFESTQETTRHALVTQAIKTGLIRADSLGLGIATDATGHAIRDTGAPHTNVRVIGVMLRGTLWESASMPEIRVFAGKLARDILGAATQPARTRSLSRGANAAPAPQ